MSDQLTIRFGGDGNIKVDTLTGFLESYRSILYTINEELGYSPSDLVVEVSPPENGSFKIKLSPKYHNALLNTLGGTIATVFGGLLVVYLTSSGEPITEEEMKEILDNQNIEASESEKGNIYNVYQNTGANQQIHQTFVIVNDDQNVEDFTLEKNGNQVLQIPRTDFQSLADAIPTVQEEQPATEQVLRDEVNLVIKTIHFEGHAKWAFIYRGYPIKALIKDESFLERLSSEAFRKGDTLKVVLARKQVYDESLETFIVDQSSYVIESVIEHKSKHDGQERMKL